ncbi:hypothetical protein BDY19DRAFT_915067 [Irpex rosettiformis]|uniref:Uncharacterized protein n=1 Tax=Irpex rosettiformis TaxID=378272 RepID=A0ACB8UKQ6_9APHY|nr:hypothetical protein BDY19DRAFT_915067 [Irpex rosettiformis]
MTSSSSPRIPPPMHPSLRCRNEPVSRFASQPSPSTTPCQPSRPTTFTVTSTSTPSTTAKGVHRATGEEEEALTELQLRQLYDEEEVDHFLKLFSDYIREVTVPQSQPCSGEASPICASSTVDLDAESGDENSTWVSQQEGKTANSPTIPTNLSPTQGLAEWIAYCIMPYLPPVAPPSPPLTIRSVRLLIHRVLVVIFHTYMPLLSRAMRLASWNDPKTSTKYCILYWFLWYHDLLITSLIARLLYSLVRRKYLPYPSLDELRQRRREQDRADDLTERLITRLAASPAEHVKDFWNTFKEYRSSKKSDSRSTSPVPEIIIGDVSTEKGVEDLSEDGMLISDHRLYSHIFDFVNKLADLHERIRNLFLWRRPQVSSVFAFLLLGMFFVSLLPVKYVFKFVTFVLGLAFWHVIPILVALPRRLPTPLASVPTDAEYAMDLISQRVAQGLPVQPKARKHGKYSFSTNGTRSRDLNGSKSFVETDGNDSDPDVDWQKWKGRLEDAKTWHGGLMASFKDGTWKDPDSWRQKTKFGSDGQTDKVETHTYPAQCKVPGLITLTDTHLFFAPLTSLLTTVTIDLKKLTGVKRSSLTKGLKVRWTNTQEDGKTAEQEERFLCVIGRDDLFARLVGSQSGRWLHP